MYIIIIHDQPKTLIKTNIRKLCISYKGVDIFNNLPSDLKETEPAWQALERGREKGNRARGEKEKVVRFIFEW